jgi:uncharacterized repeat protein (TIGR01451 family)/fimbrial isopeptide formation D2 family protein
MQRLADVCFKLFILVTVPLITLSMALIFIGPVNAQETDPNQPTPLITTTLPAATIEPTSTATPEFTATPALELTTAGLIEPDVFTSKRISASALAPVDCGVMSPPVVGYEVSKGQDPDDITDFINDLRANGFSVGAVNIGGGVPPPACVDVLIAQGSARGGALPIPYTAADGALLQAWAAAGHGLMISGDWGPFRAGTEALFQTYGYSQQGPVAVSDPTDFDAAGPGNNWVMYQTDNFAAHPILNGVTSLELLASSSLAPATNAIVTTDADATPAGAPVMAAFAAGAGCVALVADSNWNGTLGYSKAQNALVARQMAAWLNGCASLKLTKTVIPNPVLPGQILTYTLTAINDSGGIITNVIITDTVPASATFVAATLPHAGPDVNRVITWSPGALNPGTSAAVTMTVQVDNTVLTGTLITNTASVTCNQGLTDEATVVSLVGDQQVNPTIIKAVTPNQAQIGDVVTFTLTVRQVAGNSNATNVRIVDTLPVEVDIESVQVSAGVTTTTGRTITWTIATLGPIAIEQMTIRARVNSNANVTFQNQAMLSFDQGADLPSNIVEVFVPSSAPPPPPPPPPAPSDKGSDDDADGDSPPPATPTPVLIAAVAAVPTPGLPVAFLPETGILSTSRWISFMLKALLVMGGVGLLLKWFEKIR